jgi:monoamine oxidase
MTKLPFAGLKHARGIRSVGKALRVTVLGAGIAGLAAAIQLDWDGCDVTVVEVRDEPGGRVRTLRGTPSAGALVELGAARIASHHDYALGCIRWLGLEVEPFYPERGELVTERAGAVTRSRVSGLGHATHLALTEGTFPERRGFLERLRDRLVHRRWRRIRGGADRLPRAMAEALWARIHYGTMVHGLEQDGRSVRVECRSPSGRAPQVLTADRVICTLPFPVLRDVGFRPVLPPDKARVIAGLGYQSAVRVALAMDHGWDPGAWSGFGWSDRLGELWMSPGVDEAGGRTLVWYAVGAHARALGAMPEPQRHAQASAALDRLVPGLSKLVRNTVSFAWEQDPWSRGAQSQVWEFGIEHLPVIRRAEGRIHFAGEHTAGRHRVGWLDGALQSGVRAAREVQEAG